MERLTFQEWVIEIDPKLTRDFYGQLLTPACECRYCRNYREACATLPQPVIGFMKALGVDPLKGGEVFELGLYDEDKRRYGGFYHLCGRILSGPVDCKTDWEAIKLIELENFRFGFSADLELVPRDFPEPILQLEFEAKLPWLLEEDPEEKED